MQYMSFEWSSLFWWFPDVWSQVVAVFSVTVLGMTAWQLAMGCLICIVFLFIRKLFADIVIARLHRFTLSTKTDIDDEILASLSGPLKMLPIVAGIFFFTGYFVLTADAMWFFESFGRSLLAFSIFWAAFNILKPLSRLVECALAKLTQDSKNVFAEEGTNLIINGARLAILSIGLLIILSQWGINIWPMLGGLGIIGMVIGLASQETIANIFSGGKLILDGNFKRGDWIRTPSVEGIVESLGIMTTKVRGFDKALQSIPNKLLAEEPITNYAKMPFRRINMTIGVEYRTKERQLANITARIRDYLYTHPDIVQPSENPDLDYIDEEIREKITGAQLVHLSAFNDSSIDINIYCFVKFRTWAKWREVRHQLILELKRIVEDEGAGFAFPSQSLYLESTPENQHLMDLGTKDPYAQQHHFTDAELAAAGEEDGDG